MSTIIREAQFSIGQLVHHKLFGYRGVIRGIDADFKGSAEWYDHVARTHHPERALCSRRGRTDGK